MGAAVTSLVQLTFGLMDMDLRLQVGWNPSRKRWRDVSVSFASKTMTESIQTSKEWAFWRRWFYSNFRTIQLLVYTKFVAKTAMWKVAALSSDHSAANRGPRQTCTQSQKRVHSFWLFLGNDSIVLLVSFVQYCWIDSRRICLVQTDWCYINVMCNYIVLYIFFLYTELNA